jgi:hypothetical protein
MENLENLLERLPACFCRCCGGSHDYQHGIQRRSDKTGKSMKAV